MYTYRVQPAIERDDWNTLAEYLRNESIVLQEIPESRMLEMYNTPQSTYTGGRHTYENFKKNMRYELYNDYLFNAFKTALSSGDEHNIQLLFDLIIKVHGERLTKRAINSPLDRSDDNLFRYHNQLRHEFQLALLSKDEDKIKSLFDMAIKMSAGFVRDFYDNEFHSAILAALHHGDEKKLLFLLNMLYENQIGPLNLNQSVGEEIKTLQDKLLNKKPQRFDDVRLYSLLCLVALPKLSQDIQNILSPKAGKKVEEVPEALCVNKLYQKLSGLITQNNLSDISNVHFFLDAWEKTLNEETPKILSSRLKDRPKSNVFINCINILGWIPLLFLNIGRVVQGKSPRLFQYHKVEKSLEALSCSASMLEVLKKNKFSFDSEGVASAPPAELIVVDATVIDEDFQLKINQNNRAR